MLLQKVIFHRYWLITIGCFCYCSLFAQPQPLSRDDSARISLAQQVYTTRLAENNLKEASRQLNDIAFLYWEHNQYKSAINYYEQSLTLNEKLGNENGQAMIHNNLGMLYADVRDYKSSLDHFEKTLAARRSFKNREGLLAALKNISIVLNNLKRYDESLQRLEEAATIARELNNVEELRSCYSYLSETFEKAGNTEKSIQYYRLVQSLNNILLQKKEVDLSTLRTQMEEEKMLKEIAENKEKIQTQVLIRQKYELQKSELELNKIDSINRNLFENLSKSQLELLAITQKAEIDSLRAVEQLQRDAAIIQKERSWRNLLLICALSLGLISFFIYRNFIQEKKSKTILAAKNEEIARQNQELEGLNRIIAKHNERMQSELNVGREIQMSMIPRNFPELKSVELFATLEPAREVGGDLYDFFMVDEQHLIFGIGDVSDKGVPAALFMAVTKTLVKTNAQYFQSPAKVLTQVNQEICNENESSMFVSYFLGILNIKSGQLAYCNAGHNPPLLIHTNGDIHKLEELHGPVLGAVDHYEYTENRLNISPGDQILLYTDGITEAMDRNKKLYSNDRLVKIFKDRSIKRAEDSVVAIIKDVLSFRGNADQNDDMTVLSVFYKGDI